MFARIAIAAALTAGVAAVSTAPLQAAPADPPIQITPHLSQRVVKSGETSRVYLKLGIKVARVERAALRAPLNVALVIDRSGSMQGARIEGARQAAMMAIDRLSPRDIVSVVSYDDKVEVEVPATRATDPASIKERIRRLTPRGSTAIHAGLMSGLGEVRKFQSKTYVNRIILLSDGLANVGPQTPEHFAKLGREIAGEGVTVSTIGLGLGYNEDLMSKLAVNADGGHVFVQEPADLTAFLNREIDDVQGIYAQDIDVTIELKSHVRPIRALGREATINGTTLSWKIAQLVGGTEHVLLAEIETPAGLALEPTEIGAVRVTFRTAATGEQTTRTDKVMVQAARTDVEIEAGIDAEVMRETTLLIAREKKDAAIKLRDAGRLDEARQAFESNAAEIDAKSKTYKFKLDGLVQQEQAANRAAASAKADAEWNKARKIMRGQDSNAAGAVQRY